MLILIVLFMLFTSMGIKRWCSVVFRIPESCVKVENVFTGRDIELEACVFTFRCTDVASGDTTGSLSRKG